MSALDFDVVQDYLGGLVPPRPVVLVEMEQYAAQHDFPIIGPVTGQLCYQLARLMSARRVFELGSGFGYSTAWFARAVQENGGGAVHHTVWEPALSRQAKDYLTRLDLAPAVRFHTGEAVAALQQEPGLFDIIFNDIDKEQYPASLPIVKEKLRSGGLLIIDNMLWYGRIFDPGDRSEATRGVREFTRLVTADPDWTVNLVPVRDGVILAYKH